MLSNDLKNDWVNRGNEIAAQKQIPAKRLNLIRVKSEINSCQQYSKRLK